MNVEEEFKEMRLRLAEIKLMLNQLTKAQQERKGTVNYDSFAKLYRLGNRLIGYGTILFGVGLAFAAYMSMLVRLNNKKKPDELWAKIMNRD